MAYLQELVSMIFFKNGLHLCQIILLYRLLLLLSNLIQPHVLLGLTLHLLLPLLPSFLLVLHLLLTLTLRLLTTSLLVLLAVLGRLLFSFRLLLKGLELLLLLLLFGLSRPHRHLLWLLLTGLLPLGVLRLLDSLHLLLGLALHLSLVSEVSQLQTDLLSLCLGIMP